MYPGWKGHMGIDFPNPIGAADYATHDSVIISVKEDTSPNSYGYNVIEQFEEDGFTWQVIHAHHKENSVVVGQQMKAGDKIGEVGMTGFTTGPHVHLGLQQFKDGKLLNYNNGFFGYIDPMPYLLAKEDEPMKLVNNNGTFYLEGDKGHIGINKPEFLNELLKITDVIENRAPVGSQIGVVETSVGFVIKDK
jgi:hypothetical protein